MHEGDNIENGFEWIECQNYKQNILAFIRFNKKYEEFVVYLINFSKKHFEHFRLGVPFAGKYYKVIDTDSTEFGGNGHNWINEYETGNHSSFNHQHSFCTKLLPLHGMIFKGIDIHR